MRASLEKMHWYLTSFALLWLFCCDFTAGQPISDVEMLDDVTDKEPHPGIDPDIEKIANKEYETVHGRVLAVNMAHWEKRKQELRHQETTNTRDTNVFGRIEKVNEGRPLHGLYQGDIVMDEELEELLHLPLQRKTKRNAVMARKTLWTSRIIPYTIPSFMSHITSNFMKVIGDIQKSTCLRFVPYQPQIHKNYITFSNSNGCSSRIGKRYAVYGGQTISLGSGCNFYGTILHELLHAIGFFHEQSRSDRDSFVSIKWENVLDGAEDQFDKYTWRTIDHLGKNYDYESIMHYDRRAFSKNGKPTIVAVGNENMEFGRKDSQMSILDIIEINALYDCQTTRHGWTKWSEFTPCDKKCYKSRERYCYHSGDPRQCGANVNDYGIEMDRQKCTTSECLSCQDKYVDCIKWSTEGECKVNEVWMKEHCPKSCHVCGVVCEDSDESKCPQWAKNGECTKNKPYMHVHCQKSCGICKVVTCEDNVLFKSQCPAWAGSGECTKNEKWMHDHCAKSCKTC